MTQALIDQELGTPLLMRTAFFNQNAAALLLDAGDKEFKAELAKVVDLDIWEAAKERAADMLKAPPCAPAALPPRHAGRCCIDLGAYDRGFMIRSFTCRFDFLGLITHPVQRRSGIDVN